MPELAAEELETTELELLTAEELETAKLELALAELLELPGTEELLLSNKELLELPVTEELELLEVSSLDLSESELLLSFPSGSSLEPVEEQANSKRVMKKSKPETNKDFFITNLLISF